MPGIFALGAVLRSQQRHSCSKDQVSGWWHQALRQMLVSEVSNFVVAFRHLHRHISDVWICIYVCICMYEHISAVKLSVSQA